MGDVTGRAGELRPQQEPAAALKGSPPPVSSSSALRVRGRVLYLVAEGRGAKISRSRPSAPMRWAYVDLTQRVHADGGSVWLVLGTHPGDPFGVHSVLAVAPGGAREELVEGDDVALTPAGRLALEAAR